MDMQVLAMVLFVALVLAWLIREVLKTIRQMRIPEGERNCPTCVDGGKPSRHYPCSDCHPPKWEHWRPR